MAPGLWVSRLAPKRQNTISRLRVGDRQFICPVLRIATRAEDQRYCGCRTFFDLGCVMGGVSKPDHSIGLRPFLTLDDVELHIIAFF